MQNTSVISTHILILSSKNDIIFDNAYKWGIQRMMTLIKDVSLDSRVESLLAYATDSNKVTSAYERYLADECCLLYGYEVEGELVGVVGVQLTDPDEAEILQIAVDPDHRGCGIGKHMLSYLAKWHELTKVIAKTDAQAVEFYRTLGFTTQSLGEMYPACERFCCEFDFDKR